jgi:hypothetical protein
MLTMLLALIRETSLFCSRAPARASLFCSRALPRASTLGACASVRWPNIVLAAGALVLAGACEDSSSGVVDGSTSAIEGGDARADSARSNDPGPDPEDEDEPDEPVTALDASEPDDEDAGEGPEQETDADQAGEEAGAEELDASAPADDAGESDAAQQPAPDASEGDAQIDAATPDAGGCSAGQPADACGVCGGDGASCRHPLTGRYAARTQFYASQHASIGGSPLDLISKGSVLSLVEVSAAGVATEHYCFLELESPDGPLFVWSTPATVQKIPNTAVALEQRGSRFVRPLAAHQAYFGWLPQGAPTDCVTGQTHASGCLCVAPGALPSDEDDCRVRDIDEDTVPGGSMYLDFELHTDPSITSTQLKLNVVARLNLEWSLPPPVGNQIVGDIAGGLDQAVLSLQGELAEDVEDLENRMCDSALGHVELVRGDAFTCASILLGRAADPVGYGIFDDVLDGTFPTAAACEPAPGS